MKYPIHLTIGSTIIDPKKMKKEVPMLKIKNGLLNPNRSNESLNGMRAPNLNSFDEILSLGRISKLAIVRMAELIISALFG
jgi:hypothetical protein